MRNDDEVNVIDLSDFPRNTPDTKDKKNYYNPVEMYTQEGEYLCTYKSPAMAARELGISRASINGCCRGVPLVNETLGRIFLYKGNNIKERLKEIKKKGIVNKRRGIPVEVYSLNGKFLSCHVSMAKAAGKYNTHCSLIKACCDKKRLCIGDRIFLFFGDSIKERLKEIKRKKILDKMIEQELLKH